MQDINTLPSYETDNPWETYSWTEKQKAIDLFKFPPFQPLQAVEGYDVGTMRLRANRILIQEYRPSGLSPQGLFLSRDNWRHPSIMGHVLAVPEGCLYDVLPGQFVIFERLATEVLEYEKFDEAEIDNEEAGVGVINCEAILAVVNPSPVRLRL